jgi:signal transduction protein with GAF and PtsI domain
MASDPLSAFLLLGLGFRVLSVAAPALPLMRWLVRQIDVSHATSVAQAALVAPNTAEITRRLQEGVSVHVDLRWLEAGRLPRGRRSATLKA